MKIMKIKQINVSIRGTKIFIKKNDKEIARTYLYILKNDLHQEPFGLLEDVFVEKDFRNRGIGKKLIQTVIKQAKKHNCYKLLATSRYSNRAAHRFYTKLGFENHGIEFRIDFKKRGAMTEKIDKQNLL